MDTRYTAEWIVAQYHDEHGEWEPDRDELMKQPCATLQIAKSIAVRKSKKANCVEWCRVSVEQFNTSLGISRHSDAAWDTIAIHSGDWQGNWSEERYD